MPPLHKERERKDSDCLAKQIKEDADPDKFQAGGHSKWELLLCLG